MDVNIKSYRIGSLFDIYIDIGDNVAGEQDMQKLSKMYTFHILALFENNCFCSGIYVSTVMMSSFTDILEPLGST